MRSKTSPKRLTPRQQEILGLMSKGLTSREIAHRLAISPITVRNHKSVLYSRLKARNAGEAIAIGVRKGWIE